MDADTEEGLKLARAAVAYDAEDPISLRAAAWAEVFLAREHETALSLIDRSLVLDPNLAMAYGFRAWTKIWGELVEESLEDLERALRLKSI